MARTGLVLLAMVVLMASAALTQARYLPTRSDDARMDDIRELLREILERTAEGGSSRVASSGYEKRFLFKRAAGTAAGTPGTAGTAAEGGAAAAAAAEVVQPLLHLQQ